MSDRTALSGYFLGIFFAFHDITSLFVPSKQHVTLLPWEKGALCVFTTLSVFLHAVLKVCGVLCVCSPPQLCAGM